MFQEVLSLMPLSSSYFFDYTQFFHKSIFQNDPFPWVVLQHLVPYLKDQLLGHHQGTISPSAYLIHPELISIGEGSIVEPGAYIQGPCIIGKHCVVRHGAYVRGNVLIGDHCVIGHDSEIKHSILLDKAHAAHFAYVGDSILGNEVNLGAGTKCANVKLDQKTINLHVGEQRIVTPMRKLGAIIGDKTQLGCNTVTNPGTLIGQSVRCYPCLNIEGYIPSYSLIKPSTKPLIISYQE
jgi:UDP-N-acetylglucosamine diphosphorylase / glucose-1-phosphate thymidylyltransferase / UDP-N-acetylgalactosamine diphosphorylase / glucosamine-1-phosphate N-acetyltransferase / galactosamine-1-phosphate N-acetyltransferase